MSATLSRQARELQPYAQSWVFSLLCHALAVGSAVTFLGDLKLAPRPEPFKWDIALVETPKPIPVAQPQPPVQAEQAVRPVEKTVAQQEVRQEAQDLNEVKPDTRESPQPMPAVIQAVQPVDSAQEKPQEKQKELMQTVEAYPVPSEPTAPVIQAVRTVFQPSPPAMPAQVESTVAAEPPAIASASPTSVQEQAAAKQSQDPEAIPLIQEATIRDASVRPASTTRADYSWLAKTLWDRVAVLKRYPYAARIKHLEGRVMLRAVIQEGGHLMDVQVVESSGHSILDRDALEVVRRACPLKLDQPIGRPHVVVQVPISYQLER